MQPQTQPPKPEAGAPHRGKWVAYYRVSTDKQGRSGLGLEAQKTAVAGYLNGGQWTMVAEFTEVESGKVRERPELAKALAAAKKAKAKLIVSRMDRLARDARTLLELIDAGVDIAFVDLPQIPTGPTGRFMLTALAAVAELEAGLISDRTTKALAQAKERGVKLGSPKIHDVGKLGRASSRAKADQFAANVAPLIRELQSNGVSSYRAIARALELRGIKTARGGTWTPVHVHNILKRTGASA